LLIYVHSLPNHIICSICVIYLVFSKVYVEHLRTKLIKMVWSDFGHMNVIEYSVIVLLMNKIVITSQRCYKKKLMYHLKCLIIKSYQKEHHFYSVNSYMKELFQYTKKLNLCHNWSKY
jgi:hypothetical protein